MMADSQALLRVWGGEGSPQSGVFLEHPSRCQTHNATCHSCMPPDDPVPEAPGGRALMKLGQGQSFRGSVHSVCLTAGHVYPNFKPGPVVFYRLPLKPLWIAPFDKVPEKRPNFSVFPSRIPNLGRIGSIRHCGGGGGGGMSDGPRGCSAIGCSTILTYPKVHHVLGSLTPPCSCNPALPFLRCP